MFVLVYGAVIGWALLALCCVVGAAIPVRSRSQRVRNVLITALAALGLSAVLGKAALWLGAIAPLGSVDWIAASFASVTPLRSAGLTRAETIVSARLRDVDPREISLAFAVPRAVDREALRRYARIARLRGNCKEAPQFLAWLARRAPDACIPAVDVALECRVWPNVERIALDRSAASDLELASEIYDHAAVTWAPRDPLDENAGILRPARYRDELATHVIAARLDRGARTILRFQAGAPPSRELECTRYGLLAASGDSDARNQLEQRKDSDPTCALQLAGLTDWSQRKPLVTNLWKNDPIKIRYLYLLRAWDLDASLLPDVTLDLATAASLSIRPESPHDILLFPYGDRVPEPAVSLATLERLATMKQISTPLRVARARLHTVAARFYSSIGDHELARGEIRSALADYAELGQLKLEATLTRALGISIELIAGDIDRAASAASSLPDEMKQLEKDESAKIDLPRARASIDLVLAFVELWRGRPQPLKDFDTGKECEALSDCFVLHQDLERWVRASQGDVENCEATICLASARIRELRPRLESHVYWVIDHASLELDPFQRLIALGDARRLDHAIGEKWYSDRLERWLPPLRAQVLDPKLAAVHAVVRNTFR